MDFVIQADGTLVLDSIPLAAVVQDDEMDGGEMRLDIEHRDGATDDDAVFDGWEPWRIRLTLLLLEPVAGGTERRRSAIRLRTAARELDGTGLPVVHSVAGGAFASAGADRALLTRLAISNRSDRDTSTARMEWLERDPADGLRQKQVAADAADAAASADSTIVTDATAAVDSYLGVDDG